MNNKEAIQVLKRTAWLGGETYGLQNRADQVAEAIRMAIDALEKLDNNSAKPDNSINNSINNSNNSINNSIKNCVKGLTTCRVPEDKEPIDDDTVCVVFCNWNVAKKLVDKDANIEDCLVISSYLDDDEAIVVSKDDFVSWVRRGNDDTVSIQTYMQCAWERDTAIEQLRELGYDFGEKIRTDGDTISRQAAIDALTEYGNGRTVYIGVEEAIRRIEQLPLAQPDLQPTYNQLATDCISRQAAIDAIKNADVCMVWNGEISAEDAADIAVRATKYSVVDSVEELPSVQPEIIRCKDCKHKYIENLVWHCPFGLIGGENFFCGYGSLGRAERRTDDKPI